MSYIVFAISVGKRLPFNVAKTIAVMTTMTMVTTMTMMMMMAMMFALTVAATKITTAMVTMALPATSSCSLGYLV